MSEKALLTGTLEETNEPYAIAKIAGIKLCESYNRQYLTDFRSVMPTNLYGPHDNFHNENSHVIPALMRRIHDAKEKNQNEVIAWGSGKPKREFLYVDDMADASIHIMNLNRVSYEENTEPMLSHINVGTGLDCTIKELTDTMADVVNYKGKIVWDTTKPDGAPRKLMDVSRLQKLGWTSQISLKEGLSKSYDWFIENQNNYRR
jgi:GDP-L-fucose synthase